MGSTDYYKEGAVENGVISENIETLALLGFKRIELLYNKFE